MRIDIGSFIENLNGDKKNIIFDTLLPCKLKDFSIGAALITAGVLWLGKKSCEYGALRYNMAEYDTMVDLGIIKENE